MTVSFQQAVNADQVGTNRTVTFTLGSAPAEDDVIYLFLNSGAVNGNLTDVSGWTNMLGANAKVDSDEHSVSGFYHVVTAGEAGSSQTAWTLTNLYDSTTQNHSLIAVVYRGVDTASPVDDIDTYSNATASTDASVPALTPTVSGGKVIAFVANDAGVAAFTTPSGWTSRGVNSSGPENELFEWDTDTTVSVSTNAPTVVGANDEKAVIALVVPPAEVAAVAVVQGWGVVL